MKNTGTVQFLLNGKFAQVDFHGPTPFSPTTTLLEYIRSNSDLKGTKEGCAEGDCGACTVVLVGEDTMDTSPVLAVDSCLIFLPAVHGKAIMTVEYLSGNGSLHPVQKAMVDYDGSQCGYCTPGFVMSLYALHLNHTHADADLVLDALTGNLCRCTGYRSILEAGLNAGSIEKDETILTETLQACSKIGGYPLSIVMEEQKYFQPAELDSALRLRGMYPHALLVNGATDVALKVTKNDELIPEIIDLSKIQELSVYNCTDEEITFGAGLSLENIKQASHEDLPALYQCLAVFGSLQIRNLATLGGNIASASPIGDTLPVLMAYGARVKLASSERSREILISEFITGYRTIQLASNEILTSIIIPKPKKSTKINWYKISKRKDLDISSVSGGFFLELDDKSNINEIRLFYGGMAETPCLASNTVNSLIGKPWSREVIGQAVAYLDKDFSPISDARASAAGRKVMAKNLLWKFWLENHE